MVATTVKQKRIFMTKIKNEEDIQKNLFKTSYRDEFIRGANQAAEYFALSKEQKEQVDAEYLERKANKKPKQAKERDIKEYFLKVAKSYGAEVRKCEWYRRKDAPDWFVALNGAHFVELKRPGAKPNPSQKREADKLSLCDVPVHVLSTFNEVDDFFIGITE